jgi:hypothetical protein
MCEPTTIIAMSAMAAGTAASIAGQKKAQRAMGSAQAAENIRQSKLRDEANAVFAGSLNANTAKSRSEAESTAAAKRNESYKGDLASVKRAEVGSAYGSEAPQVVTDESGARGAAVSKGSVIDSRNKAALASFGDVTQANAVKNARARSEIGTTADFMRGSSSALGAEMEYASHAGDKLKNIGDILQKVGMVAGMYAAAAPAAAASNTVTLTGASGANAAASGVAAGKAAGAAATKTLAANTAKAAATAAGSTGFGATAGGLAKAPLSGMAGWNLVNPTLADKVLAAGKTVRSFTGR